MSRATEPHTQLNTYRASNYDRPTCTERSQGVVHKYYSWYDHGMKISVSLPDEDVEFLDSYAENQGYESRSAVVHTAVRMLRSSKLGDAYANAWQEWEESGEAEVWNRAASDGLT